MTDINKQIDKLQKELDVLKRIIFKPKAIQLAEPAKDIKGNELKLTYYDSMEYARLIGSRLATKEELQSLSKEEKDKIGNKWLWSSSPHGVGNFFYFVVGGDGSVYDVPHITEGSVICVLNKDKGE